MSISVPIQHLIVICGCWTIVEIESIVHIFSSFKWKSSDQCRSIVKITENYITLPVSWQSKVLKNNWVAWIWQIGCNLFENSYSLLLSKWKLCVVVKERENICVYESNVCRINFNHHLGNHNAIWIDCYGLYGFWRTRCCENTNRRKTYNLAENQRISTEMSLCCWLKSVKRKTDVVAKDIEREINGGVMRQQRFNALTTLESWACGADSMQF